MIKDVDCMIKEESVSYLILNDFLFVMLILLVLIKLPFLSGIAPPMYLFIKDYS
jgi:hypothetical protein